MRNQASWGEIRRPLAAGLILGLSVLLLSVAALGGAPEEVTVLPASPTPVAVPTAPPGEWDGGQTIRVLLDGGEVEEMTMADYLWRVVAAEMPASFEAEALRAQAVCARTYSIWKLSAGSHREDGADICADSSCCQAYITPDAAAQRWGDAADAYAAKLAAAVADTDGQIAAYDGAPIQAVFFSSASGSTEDASAVWGQALPYLVSVDSPEGEEVPNYHSTVTLTADEVRTLAQDSGIGADLSGDPAEWFSGISRTASGRVASLELGGAVLSGGAARSLFSLRSASFDVSEEDGVFTFSVTGYGHGVGLSQYGANAMARAGSSWQEIICHYYTGAEIQTAPLPE